MVKDILIKARILSKKWQIKQCENTIKDTITSVEKLVEEIGSIDDDMSNKMGAAQNSLYILLRDIDSYETSRLGLNQELLKLDNADEYEYCQCDSCVANRAINIKMEDEETK